MPGGIFKNAAARVLLLERRLMSTGEVTRVALRRGLLQCSGKTPEATMASALYTDVKRKEKNSVFTRPGEGLFGMREWEAEGFNPPRPGDARGGGMEGSPAGNRRQRTQTQRQSKAKREERERAAAAREAAAREEEQQQRRLQAARRAGGRGERGGGKVKPERRDAAAEEPAGGAEKGGSEGDGSLGKRKERDESILLLLSAADELDVDKNREPSVHNGGPHSKASPSSDHPSPISKLREALGHQHLHAHATTPSTPSSDEALIASGRIGAGMRLLGGTPTTFALGSGGPSPAGGMPLVGSAAAAAADKAAAGNLAVMQALEAQIGALEGAVGGCSPHVGRAWLDLTKLYHQHGLFEQAEATLLRSFLVFQKCQGQGPASDSCRLAFGNLLSTIQNSKAHRRALRARTLGPKLPADMPAAGAAPETPSGGAAGATGQPIACLSPVHKGHSLAPTVA